MSQEKDDSVTYTMPATNAMTRASCGLVQYDVADLNNAIGVANASGFDFFVGPLTHPMYKLHEVVKWAVGSSLWLMTS